jgi:magnesium chelatase subunit ChlI-like protein
VIIIGRSGLGKTLLARAMPGRMAEMSIDQTLDATRIYSVADTLPLEMLARTRPLCALHHTISHTGLVEGGNWPHPGEISLATGAWDTDVRGDMAADRSQGGDNQPSAGVANLSRQLHARRSHESLPVRLTIQTSLRSPRSGRVYMDAVRDARNQRMQG